MPNPFFLSSPPVTQHYNVHFGIRRHPHRKLGKKKALILFCRLFDWHDLCLHSTSNRLIDKGKKEHHGVRVVVAIRDMPIRLLSLSLSLLLIAPTLFAQLNDGAYGDAPHSHRRLYGIRRLRLLRPIPQTVEHSPTHQFVDRRRQPARFSNEDSEQDHVFVPRAVVPPRAARPTDSVREEVSTEISAESSVPATYIVQTPNRFEKSLDEARRKRIEARWKRLGINFKNINHPLLNSGDSTETPHQPAHPYTIRQLNVPKKSEKMVEVNRPRITEPILQVVNPLDQGFVPPEPQPQPIPAELPSSGDYHSRTKPILKGVKFVQEKLSVRPRLRIRRPGQAAELPMPEDPNLTPFMNSARAKFGYGTTILPPVETTTVYVPPTTSSQFPTTTTTTTEAPVEESFGISPGEDSGIVPDSGVLPGGDSGAGFGFGPSELPPEFQNVGFGVGGGDNGFNFNVPADKMEAKKEEATTEVPATTTTVTTPKKVVQRKQPNPVLDKDEPVVIPQNSGLRPVAPPKEFSGSGGFGSGSGGFGGGGGGFGGGGGGGAAPPAPSGPDPDFGGDTGVGPSEGDFFTGDSALTRSKGPTGDGYGPPIFPGGAAPPPVPAVGLGGAAAGKSPYSGQAVDATENPVTTVKPSALLSVLSKADMGFNQAIDHFEHGTPVETAAIDILEVALGSQKLDSQAKLLGHVDRTIGLDNLQRLQRWANTAGAMDVFKDQFLKFAKNFQPPADLLPTVPPQLEYLFKTSGK
uniref:Uncharacterized protein n=1 Tax=Caenorhabditis japonica TaxID=281687 RepID=A0A8R1DU31_CAEJA